MLMLHNSFSRAVFSPSTLEALCLVPSLRSGCQVWLRGLIAWILTVVITHGHQLKSEEAPRTWKMTEPLRSIYHTMKIQTNSQVDLSSVNAKNITTQIDQSVYLHCPFDPQGGERVSWIRLRDFHVLTVGRYTYTSDERFQVYHTDFSNDWALKIENVQQKDEGLYECQLTSDTPVSQYVYLRVVVPVAKILEGRKRYFKPGSPLNLTCFISNSPEPPIYVFWYHNQRMINYDKMKGQITVKKAPRNTAFSSLYIDNAQSSDSGNYTCAPSNADPVSIIVQAIEGENTAAVQNDGGPSMPSGVSRPLTMPFSMLFSLTYVVNDVIWR
ncbi:neurotrimin-like [Tachypleus tridentatus]|uniref:neurotrimin-like n=1 Tax=Tachypleus tridentatus TaxID=6853 RepID=UPI003FD47CC4